MKKLPQFLSNIIYENIFLSLLVTGNVFAQQIQVQRSIPVTQPIEENLKFRACSYSGKEVEAICKNQPTPTCNTCLDAWSDEKYIDKRNSSLYAHRRIATCQPCENSFKLDTGEGLQMVSCQELYQAIYHKNNGCGDCLEKKLNAGG